LKDITLLWRFGLLQAAGKTTVSVIITFIHSSLGGRVRRRGGKDLPWDEICGIGRGGRAIEWELWVDLDERRRM